MKRDARRYDGCASRLTFHHSHLLKNVLPKVKGVTSNPTERQARQFLRAWERAKRYEQKVKRLEEAVSKLQDERERMVAEALMDGEKLYMIAQELNVSRQTVHEIKRSVIKKLAFELYGEETKASLLHK
ncbi:LuxR C-terminal-related transcriptional regulator [Geobacillus kaustophilus]|uniref:LuxR C-terminal-related transcriptional regulator n=1 Tax=Geobacillus kaustophilus TaxID=1462 RepID=UPI0009E4AB41|nr:LuxR C-terminal-related transcriptional regulator [Geobacillus kaustophilus]